MIKVRALSPIFYNGRRHEIGEVFSVRDNDLIIGLMDIVETPKNSNKQKAKDKKKSKKE